MKYGKILITLCIMLMPLLLHAQDPGEPCSDNDPLDNTCPLDTWVYIMAVPAAALAALYIFKQQKTAGEAKP